MKIILTKEVSGLGDIGTTLNVKDGYGRNYLLPKGLAILATKKNITTIIANKKRIALQQANEIQRIQADADRLSSLNITIKARVGEASKLYGSVTNIDIAEALAVLGEQVNRRRIILKEPIKHLGNYSIQVKLHPQIIANIKVIVKAQNE